MRIVVAGSIATDHLLTFDGRFAESVLPDQLANLSLSFLASDLQVRRGGTGANIAYGMATLGLRPVLLGAVGADAAEYVAWLAARGVDTSAVAVSSTRATARFTCTTDRDHAQIATFYPGAMQEAAELAVAPLGDVDLVVVGPDDPTAMARHTDECRDLGIAFAADPSQQLAFLAGPAIRQLIDGAAWLFTNDYEAGLVREKTGWSEADVLAAVDTRITTMGPRGVRVSRRGQPDVVVDVVPARELAEPTGVGDAFRAGFLTASSWGVDLERCAQVGALLATLVVETVGTQDYTFGPQHLDRLAAAYGSAAADEVAGHLSKSGA